MNMTSDMAYTELFRLCGARVSFLDKTGSGKLVSPLPVMNWQGAFYVCTGSLTEYLMLAAITTHPAIRPGRRWLLRWSLPQEWVHRHRTERTGHG